MSILPAAPPASTTHAWNPPKKQEYLFPAESCSHSTDRRDEAKISGTLADAALGIQRLHLLQIGPRCFTSAMGDGNGSIALPAALLSAPGPADEGNGTHLGVGEQQGWGFGEKMSHSVVTEPPRPTNEPKPGFVFTRW